LEQFRRKIESFGSIHYSINRSFLQYILYHEMLHSVVPDEMVGGRRRVHTEEFNRRERQFPRYGRARRWEQENLARFLR
jgi:hypothetical protein